MGRVHHLIGCEIVVERLPVAERPTPHPGVGDFRLPEAAVFVVEVLGSGRIGVACRGFVLHEGVECQLERAACNHAVLERHVALGFDIVAAQQQVGASPGSGEGVPLRAFGPFGGSGGQLLLCGGQFQH